MKFKNIVVIAILIFSGLGAGTVHAATISFGTNSNPPIDVRVAPISTNSRVFWSAPNGSSPVKYQVYTRLSTEPFFYLIGSTTATQFNASYTFAGSNDATRLYSISAIAADGSESSMSETAMDNDTDGDGIPDTIETTIGTSPTNPDTDGDGLTDGQERYLFQTDPLKVDTDGNGINDYQQTIDQLNGTTPNTTNLITNPSLTIPNTATSSLPQNWSKDLWGTNIVSFNYPVTGRTDSAAAKVQITSYTNGDAKWISDLIPVTAGHSYSYSDSYQSDISSALIVQFVNASSTSTYGNYTTIPASGAWSSASLNFTPPSGTTQMRVMHLISNVGYLTIDDTLLTDQAASTTASPTITFTASPSTLSVGQSTILAWNTTNAASCAGTNFTATSTSGSIVVTPTALTTYTISCSGAGGNTTNSVIVVVNTSPNLEPNPSFITANSSNASLPQNWSYGGYGTNTATYTYPITGRTDTTAAKVQVSSYTNGDAKWVSDPISVTAGHTYTYNDWYKSDVTSQFVLEYLSASSTYSYAGFTNVASSASWATSSISFTAPANTVSAKVFHLINSVGSLTIDDVSLYDQATSTPAPTVTFSANPTSILVGQSSNLVWNSTNANSCIGTGFTASSTAGTVPVVPTVTTTYSISCAGTSGTTTQSRTVTVIAGSGSNIVLNPSLVTANSSNTSLPQNWSQNTWGTNNAAFTYPVTGQTDSAAAKVQITSYSSGDGKWEFDPVAVTPGDTYSYIDYYKSDVTTQIGLEYTSATGTVSYANFINIPASSSWGVASTTFVPPGGTATVRVLHLINAVGSLTLDDLSLADQTNSIPSVTIAPSGLSSGMVDTSFTQTFTANTIASGTFTWSIVSGSMPSGLSLATTNGTTTSITGTPTSVGTFSFGLKVSNGTSSSTQQYSLTINAAAASSTNLVLNSSFVTANASDSTLPQNWSHGGYGNNTTTYTYPITGRTDSTASKVQTTAYTDGDAKWVSDPISVIPGHTDNYSDWYKSDVSSQLVIEYVSTSNSYSYVGLMTIASSTSWTKINASFTAPTSTATARVLHLINSVGYLTLDDVSLEENLILNPSLATVNSSNTNLPLYWSQSGWGTNIATYSYPITGQTDSSAAKVQISSYTNGDAKWLFDRLSVTPGQTYSYKDAYQSDVTTQVGVEYTSATGTISYANFTNVSSSSMWGTASLTFTPPSGTLLARIVHLLNSVGYLILDDVYLK